MPRRHGAAMALAVLLPVAAAVTAGCGGGSTVVRAGIRPVVTHLVPAPTGVVYDEVVWLPRARRLVVMLIPPGKGTDPAYDHLYSLKLDGSSRRRLPLPSEKGCKLTSQEEPIPLPNGRIGYVQECWGQEIPHNAKFLRTYDLASGDVGYVRRYALPVSAGRSSVNQAGDAVINDGRGLSERLLRLGGRHADPLALPFTRVGYPSWSPSGRLLALDAVPRSEHASGIARLDLHRNLYLLDRNWHVKRLLVRDLVDAGLSSWAPNGRWLALALQRAHGDGGLYLVDVVSGAAHLVQRGDFGNATWITNRELMATVGVTSDLPGGRKGPAGLERILLPRMK